MAAVIGDDQAAHLAFSSVLSSMGGSVLFEGCPDDDMDLVWRGRVELIAVDEVLPDTSVKLGFRMKIFKQNVVICTIGKFDRKMTWTRMKNTENMES